MDIDLNELKQKIVSLSKKNEEKINALIEAKKEKFSGLLTDSGAAFMIAKELGVEIENSVTAITKINSLKDGMSNVDIITRLKQAYAPRTFDKNGKKGKLQNLILTDETGEIRATIWNNDVKKFTEQEIIIGTCLKFSNCTITEYNGTPQLNLSYNSTFTIEKESEELPKIKTETTELEGLDSGLNNLTIKATIKDIYPLREFENERGKGKVMNFILKEGLSEIRATAWNDLCEEVKKYSEGDKILIEGAYTKEGRDGVELHLGWSARVLADKSE